MAKLSIPKKDLKVLEDLMMLLGPAGDERRVQKYFGKLMKSIGYKISTDNLGNCYADLPGDTGLPKMMMSAHADSVGYQVTHIDDRGFVFTKDIGPWQTTDFRHIPATPVIIMAREIEGKRSARDVQGRFIPMIPLHHVDDEDMCSEVDERIEIPIDIGAEANEKGQKHAYSIISDGDYAVLRPSFEFGGLNGTPQVVGTNLDDRLGLFILYETAKRIQKSKIRRKCPVTFVSTVAEEVGSGSATVAAENVQPDIALVFDGTAAVDNINHTNEDYIAKKYGKIGLNKGTVIIRDPEVSGPLFSFLEGLCHKSGGGFKRIQYQTEVGPPNTENEYIKVATRKGVMVAPILTPMRNTHTIVETVDMRDVQKTLDLATRAYCEISRGKFPH